MNSLQLSRNMLRHNVIQPLNVYEQMVGMLETAHGSSNSGIQKLKREHTWRHFGPPLFNYALTALEVFLENFFLENYHKPDGGYYVSKTDFGNDMKGFCKRCGIKKMSRNVSFQRLDDVSTIYKAAFNIKFRDYDKYDLIELQFTKRHLFTHRGGLLDEKFIEDYNRFHEKSGDTSKLINPKSVGDIAFIKRSWVRDSVIEIENFINHIASNTALNSDVEKCTSPVS